jgi:predicted anti-sigma-YlaC factor YlaD
MSEQQMFGPEMTCHELVELVTEYLEDAMSAPERARLEVHLAGCRPCRHYLDQMRKSIDVMGTIPEEAVTPEAREDLLSVFRAWKRG